MRLVKTETELTKLSCSSLGSGGEIGEKSTNEKPEIPPEIPPEQEAMIESGTLEPRSEVSATITAQFMSDGFDPLVGYDPLLHGA